MIPNNFKRVQKIQKITKISNNSCAKKILYSKCLLQLKPFIGDHDGQEDGGVEDDVVDREEELGEEDGVDFTLHVERPTEF